MWGTSVGRPVRLLATGNTNKNDPNDARSVAVAALRSATRREVPAPRRRSVAGLANDPSLATWKAAAARGLRSPADCAPSLGSTGCGLLLAKLRYLTEPVGRVASAKLDGRPVFTFTLGQYSFRCPACCTGSR